MASIIKDISVENVKGYGSPAVSLPLELKTNRINIIFAPNGTGKSSLAAAFQSIERGCLKVDKDNIHHKDETLHSRLSLCMDGMILYADENHNYITPKLICQVINCATTVHTTQRNMGHFTAVSGFIDIPDIIIEPVVRPSNTGYSITKIKSVFGVNGKILDNLKRDFEKPEFLIAIKEVWADLETFGRAKCRTKLINDILERIHSLSGNSSQIFNNIDNKWLMHIEADKYYLKIVSILDELYPKETPIERFLRFFQLHCHWNSNKRLIKDATERAEYEQRRKAFDENLALLDTTWKNIHTEEIGKDLIVRFPQADEISNGQRDLLTFIVSILKFKSQIREGKKYLLIIDEVFDYLDDANMIAAQYYLTKILDLSKDNFFLCLMSHLNPYTFRSYVFSDKKLNIQYLKNTIPTASKPMMDFLSFRERIKSEGKKDDGEKSALYKKLSHDLFHYNPTIVDYSSELKSNKTASESHLNEDWGRTAVLHQILINEINKYFTGQPTYDPYAVAFALRLRVEKLAYEKLPEDMRPIFVDTPMTKKKFEYCIQNGIDIPDVYFIVSAIHNEAEHLKFDQVSLRYIEKPMVYKLQNNAIMGILKNLFEWEGKGLGTTVID